MSALDQVVSFLRQTGGQSLPPRAGVRSDEILWRIGETTIVVCELSDGTIRVDEVLVATHSLPHVLDALGNIEARRIASEETAARARGGCGTP